MITVEKLKAFGADTEEGLTRCINDEGFYIMLVESAMSDNSVEELKQQISDGDFDAAFETAHSLKGVYANLSLTPLYEIVYTVTEHLRKKEDMDYSEIINSLETKFSELCSLAE